MHSDVYIYLTITVGWMYTKARCSYVTQLRNSFIQINDFAILISGIAKGRPGQAHAHNFEFSET